MKLATAAEMREIDRRALYDVAARQGKAAIEVRLPPPGATFQKPKEGRYAD